MNLWRIKLQYENTFKKVKELPFKDLDIEALIYEIDQMTSILSKSKAFLKDDNECAENVTSNLLKFRSLAISLSKINTPAYDDRHKYEINQILGFDFYKKKEREKKEEEDYDYDDKNNKEKKLEIEMNVDMKINEFIDLNIGAKLRKLTDIDIKAKKEKELSETLNSIRTQWDQPNKLQINDQEIVKPETLFEEIDDSLAKIADVQSSKYAP